MSVQALLAEFKHEAENTRKLLKAIPDSILEWKPCEKNWTTAELASHIANIYAWYVPTFEQSVFDLGAFVYDPGDISKSENTLQKFEENVLQAKKALESATDESLLENWSMVMGEATLMEPMPRAQVVRSFLFNHLYHHRGEMIVYLRATGNPVPGLYGPTAEQMPG